jgi:ribosome-binding protein aMBF1 (putative translation factor)
MALSPIASERVTGAQVAERGNLADTGKDAIRPKQCRAARGLLGWSRDELSAASGVPARTLADFELSNTTSRNATLAGLRNALEKAGVESIAENGGGPGVRLKKKRR